MAEYVLDEVAVDAKAAAILNPNDDLMAMAGAFVESLMMVHSIPGDFDGLQLNVLRDPDTHQLLSVLLTPVDVKDGEPVARYQVDPGRLRKAAVPKIVLS